MSITSRPFGCMTDGRTVKQYALENANGMRAQIIPYGARITGLWTKDRSGRLDDVVLGYDTLEEYLRPRDSQGAIIGRYAGPIRDAQLKIGEQTYALWPNAGAHQMHGGTGLGACFSEKLWTVETETDGDEPAITLGLLSPDGDGGFPGDLNVRVTYTLRADDALRIEYEAVSSRDTALNLTSHAYFNLSGGPSIHGHELWVNAKRYTVQTDEDIPTGENAPVNGTAMDFTVRKPIGRDIAALPMGYDHNWALDKTDGPCAQLYDPLSGRLMEVYTDQPGLQVYTAGYLPEGKPGKRGSVMHPQCAVCLETQHWPDAVHHPHFPSTLLKAGETFRSTTSYAFRTE